MFTGKNIIKQQKTKFKKVENDFNSEKEKQKKKHKDKSTYRNFLEEKRNYSYDN